MNDFTEFFGKSLDVAIAEACSFYGVPREKLEIEIIEDAKTGIFGIVGARKARIKARVATLPDFVRKTSAPEGKRRRTRRDNVEISEENIDVPGETPKRDEDPAQTQEVKQPSPPAPEQESPDPAPPAEEAAGEDSSVHPHEEVPAGRRARAFTQISLFHERRTRAPKAEAERKEEGAADTLPPLLPLKELDQEKVLEQTRSVLAHLVAPILDINPEEVDLTAEISDDRVLVSVKTDETGLLIGREGQNLAAVQYLASRIVTRALGAQVRIQVDAGDYHMRQDTRLQELAFSLAEKVKATGKPQTTRPLSAYQRRVIHLTLQDDPEVQTRSTGEGPFKHMVILRRKD